MYARSATKKEVDFCGKPRGKAAFEGKHTDAKLARDTQTMAGAHDVGGAAPSGGDRARHAGGNAYLASPYVMDTMGETR